MLLERVFFNVVAISLLIIIFFKIIKKNDTNYFGILLLQLVGIIICFCELNLEEDVSVLFDFTRYIFSIVIPGIVVFIEYKGINFSEIFSILKAHFYVKIGNNKKAKECLVALTNRYPNSYIGHKLLAEIYEKEGGMRKAIDEYVKAIDIKKNDHKSYFKIAKLLNDLDKKDEAVEMLQTLLKTQPDCRDATMLLGEMLCEQERFKEAASVYLDAAKYHTFDFELFYNLGIVYTRLNDFQQAKEMYERAAEINSLLYGAKYNLALIALIQKELDDAEKYFEECVYDEELEPFAYYNLAKIAVLKGDKAKAITFLNKAIELDPNLLNKANNDKSFESIKSYITVSVRMNDEPKKEKKKKSKLEKRAKTARIYLENTNELVDDIEANTNKQKVSDKVDFIINSERFRQEQDLENMQYEKEHMINNDEENKFKEKNETNNE